MRLCATQAFLLSVFSSLCPRSQAGAFFLVCCCLFFDNGYADFYRKFDSWVLRLRNTVLGHTSVAVKYRGCRVGGFRKTRIILKFGKLPFTSHVKI